jgi:hypothetical protein
MELRTINLSEKHFECGGRNFNIYDSLSFVRYRELQKLNLEFGFSATFIDIFENVRKAMELMNKVQFVDAAVTLHNILSGIASYDDKNDPALRMCALFINEDTEDVTTFEEGKMREKIECWSKELAVLPFFQLAANLVPGWMNVYKIVTQDGSEQAAKEETT